MRRPPAPPPVPQLPRQLRMRVLARQNGRCLQCGGHLILGFFSFRPMGASADPHLFINKRGDDLVALCWLCNPETSHV
jgi:hypothetical protein